MSETSSETKIIFETSDPLKNVVSLSQDTWDNHIVSGHPEMAGEEKKVKKAILNPDAIYYEQDEVSSTRVYFYEHGSSRLKPWGKYVLVPVNVDCGAVKTAYPSDYLESDGTEIYNKNNKKEQSL